MSLLENELSEVVSNALIDAGVPLDVVVSRSMPGNGPPQNPGPSTVTHYTGRGFIDTYEAAYMAGTLIQAGDVRVFVLVSSLAIEPKPGDTVTARGKTYSVISVSADPALALWELQGRA